jgi:hypothetical protein
MQLLDDLEKTIRYWNLNEEALACTKWETLFGRVYGPVLRKTVGWINL